MVGVNKERNFMNLLLDAYRRYSFIKIKLKLGWYRLYDSLGIIFFIEVEVKVENIIYDILFFLIVFLVIFVINYISSLKKIKKKKKLELVDYLVTRFKLSPKKIKARKMVLTISLINAFIISSVATCITMLDISFIWQFMIGFVLVFALIYSLYEIYGRYLVNKGYGKENRK